MTYSEKLAKKLEEMRRARLAKRSDLEKAEDELMAHGSFYMRRPDILKKLTEAGVRNPEETLDVLIRSGKILYLGQSVSGFDYMLKFISEEGGE
jgi:hypothetical protein